MDRSLGPILGSLVTFALLAGCSGPAPRLLASPQDGTTLASEATVLPPLSNDTLGMPITPFQERHSRWVYDEFGPIVGATPSNPVGFDTLVPDGKPTRVDTFEAPKGTFEFLVFASVSQSVGSSRIEIHAANGTMVFASPLTYGHGPAGSGSFAMASYTSPVFAGGEGRHTVSYYIVGSYTTWVRVAAYILGPAPADTAYTGPSLYRFFGTIYGASPPNPLLAGYGPTVPDAEPAHEGTFEVPAGTKGLDISANNGYGWGSSRVEITAPDGTLVYSTIRLYGNGPLGPACVGCGSVDGGEVVPGTYTVSYYVAGTFDIRVLVTGSL